MILILNLKESSAEDKSVFTRVKGRVGEEKNVLCTLFGKIIKSACQWHDRYERGHQRWFRYKTSFLDLGSSPSLFSATSRTAKRDLWSSNSMVESRRSAREKGGQSESEREGGRGGTAGERDVTGEWTTRSRTQSNTHAGTQASEISRILHVVVAEFSSSSEYHRAERPRHRRFASIQSPGDDESFHSLLRASRETQVNFSSSKLREWIDRRW